MQIVTKDDLRPASRKAECFYCKQPISGVHLADCVQVHDNYTPCVVFIKKVSTGEVVQYRTDIWSYGGLNFYLWEHGNYSCDCNRALFFERTKGNEPENINCGESEYVVEIEVHGKIQYKDI